MIGRFANRRIGEALRRQLEVAAAAAREQLLETHAAFALELVERSSGQIAPSRAIAIYSRLHRLEAQDAHIVGSRVLATLGQRMAESTAAPPPPAVEEELPSDPWDSPRSLLGHIQKRIRGRVNQEMRRWVELQTGRAEMASVQVHVEHALRFVNILKPEGSIAGAVEVYLEMVKPRKALNEPIYFRVLDRLARPEAVTPPVEVPPAAARIGQPLRIVKEGP